LLRYATTGHALDETFTGFVDRVAGLVPAITLKKDNDASVALPSLFIGKQLTYQALPLDRELEPFLTALGDDHAFSDRIPVDVRQRLVRLQVPALLKVYISRHCPHCPTTVAMLLGLAATSEQVRLTIIDGELFAGAAADDQVKAVPTVMLDDQFRWTGSVVPDELVTLMLDRDPASLGADALRGMIEAGNAEGVANMMAERGKLFPAFIKLLTHPRWSVRLGAMVAFETLAEDHAGLAVDIVEPLVAVFADVDATVKGDLIHVLGESGNTSALPFLQGVAADEYDDDVQSAAEEAIEKLS
jgi:hypothetical protein